MSIKVAKNLFGKDKDTLVQFYETNKDNVINYSKKNANNLLICNYNVHGWVNINDTINVNDNFDNIINMISNCNDIDIIVLEEVCFRQKDGLTQQFIENKFKTIGFVDNFTVENGGCFLKKGACDYIMIFGKKPFSIKHSINITEFIFKRLCLLIEYDKIKIIAVHLEIGKRFHHLPKNKHRSDIEKENTAMRIKELTYILQCVKNIDIIVGDFNFSYQDPEFNWVLDKGFEYCKDLTHTTPYNRTDMVFVNNNNNKLINVNNVTINANFSDHLPIICELILKT